MSGTRSSRGYRRAGLSLALVFGLFAGLAGRALPQASDAQPIDPGYTAKIREYTTLPVFLTELVDHLPASDRVPTPEKVLGHIVGAPDRLTYSRDIHAYFRALAQATPRVRVLPMPEPSEEGKEQILVLVSDEANLQRLDRYKEITARLADPRGLPGETAQQLVREGKVFYWVTAGLHSPETAAPEMVMELGYRLAVGESPLIQAIRRDVIVMITPVLDVDGRDRMVDLYRYRKANPGKPAPPLVFWGKYVAHDNNRDLLGMALALTRNAMRTFLEYHPQVMHDLHESVPFLYTSTGTGPYNAWLDPIVIDEWHLLAYHEVHEMTRRGVPGVWTHGFYDGWAPNYLFYAANGHNAIGRFYETFGNGGADTMDRTVGAQAQRAWFRPNPPYSRVRWSLRNNINLSQSALLLALHLVATQKERFLHNFYLKSRRAVDKARNEGPAAYVIPEGGAPRPRAAADLVRLLRAHGIEVHLAPGEIDLGEQKFPAGSYVIRMDQPYSRMADMLLDTQFYHPNDPTPYDDTGWTLGALRNVRTVRVTDRRILDAVMVLLTQDPKVPGRVTGSPGAAVYAVAHTGEDALAPLRFRLKEVKALAAEAPFQAAGQSFPAGTFLFPAQGNSADLRRRLETVANELGLTVHGLDAMPAVPTHEVAVPRIAILHTWTSTQNDGWYRYEFDRLRIPYDYIAVQTIRDTPELRRRWDVIVLPPVGNSAQALVNGVPRHHPEPIPWKRSDLTPNIGLSPAQTDDIRGGIELQGMANLQRFVEEGGLFVVVGGTARLPIDYGLVTGVSIAEPQQLRARGSVFQASVVDRLSPIAYGYDETLAVYFNQSPLLQVAFGGGGGGGTIGRPSGRGSLTDPDIPQGRPPQPGRFPSDAGPSEDERRAGTASLFEVPASLRPRVVVRFATDERQLLVSGMLAGGGELAGRPAVVDVPVGKGHVVIFAIHPMWRHQTQGSICLLLNAAIHYNHLGAGRAASPRGEARPRRGTGG